MDFSGRHRLTIPPARVFKALYNPMVLRAAIPGCERLERLSDGAFRASIGIAPQVRFKGTLELVARTPPAEFSHMIHITYVFSGDAAGSARGESDIRLAEDAGGTLLRYDVSVMVTGDLAQTDPSAMDNLARRFVHAFFNALAARLDPQEGLTPQIWVAGLVGIVITLLIVFSVVL